MSELIPRFKTLDPVLQMHGPASRGIIVQRVDPTSEVFLDILITPPFVDFFERQIGDAQHSE